VSRGLKTTIAILSVLVVFGLITLPSLRQAMQRISATQRTEEQARHDVMQVPVSTPTDVKVKAQMYWLSATSPASLEATTIELPLSADPVERSKQLILALMANAPSTSQRTLPPDALLLAFYLQPGGTGVADFSDALSSETPSGIQSEQLAVDSIARTLGANVNVIHQLKILIHGQEVETLAGHLDLSGLFPVSPPSAADAVAAPADSPVTTGAVQTTTTMPALGPPGSTKKVPQ
jgi:Sporulation and spore germination